jgi:glycosyltransferase involved in cell wall biosynthesis
MYSRRDVIGEAGLEARLATLGQNRPLKAVYAGRFQSRKGLHKSIAAIAEARRLGVNVEYHLYGTGPEERSLRQQVTELGLNDAVTFHGFVDYGPKFIDELGAYDLLLFLPIEEDTPRMLYDAMAAGLPLLGSGIPFLRHRVESDRMGLTTEVGNSRAAALCLEQLSNETPLLSALSRAAGLRHSMEEWYRRRAEWTQQALERHLSKSGPTP